ncbi:lecithin retinol acyltransferase family protein [Ammoniphilus sp. CFH 90114]|uniref:lecithin retinol acyltransferase family protein n=1 Tax=Ammoniphilus sp. CFH 90114 TaxID=2493665 RepID=UPI00100F06CC|nr:lecithin retinol acyltransferase family protein [Ammoniphilus sp. CFH 90114]RXT15403.1 hypothetical protein EIZ39_04170 [Ammoniphilus sp. CFH 90114]
MNFLKWWKGKEKKNTSAEESSTNSDVKVIDKTADTTTNYRKADHLVVNRLGNTHHGIYSGEGNVIYYNYYTGVIVEATLNEYAKGDPIKVVYSPQMYNSSTVLARARSRVGVREYNMMLNIGEQFVRWARGGDTY